MLSCGLGSLDYVELLQSQQHFHWRLFRHMLSHTATFAAGLGLGFYFKPQLAGNLGGDGSPPSPSTSKTSAPHPITINSSSLTPSQAQEQLRDKYKNRKTTDSTPNTGSDPFYAKGFGGWSNEAKKILTDLQAEGYILRSPGGRPNSFVSGGKYADRRLKQQMCFHPDKRTLAGVIYFGPDTEGPPKCAHGGSIAAIADSVCGQAVWLSGFSCVTVALEVSYVMLVPLNAQFYIEATVENVEHKTSRKVFVTYKLTSLDGKVIHSKGKGLFVTPKSWL